MQDTQFTDASVRINGVSNQSLLRRSHYEPQNPQEGQLVNDWPAFHDQSESKLGFFVRKCLLLAPVTEFLADKLRTETIGPASHASGEKPQEKEVTLPTLPFHGVK